MIKIKLDLKEYISSGILELYAAGALSETEAREVEAMAGKHPEVKAELDAIQKALTDYAGAYSKNPRPELRQKVLDKIDRMDELSNLIYMQNAQPSEEPAVKMQPSVYQRENQMNQRTSGERSSRYTYLMAAVWAFLILNIFGNIFFYTKLKGTEEQMAAVINENTKMKSEYEKIKLDMEKKQTDMKMVMNRQNKIVDMKGMEIAPQSFATVYWNPNTKQVMLNVDNLPMPPTDKQYQLWALKDGKPIDAGVFDMKPGAAGDMHMMPVAIPDADAFAITLEKKGGSPTPTLTQLYVMGKI
jgi:anti-sigma-K factor RskA